MTDGNDHLQTTSRDVSWTGTGRAELVEGISKFLEDGGFPSGWEAHKLGQIQYALREGTSGIDPNHRVLELEVTFESDPVRQVKHVVEDQVDPSQERKNTNSGVPERPTIVQIEAAKLRLVTDRRLGKQSPEWLQRVAKGLPAQSVKAAG